MENIVAARRLRKSMLKQGAKPNLNILEEMGVKTRDKLNANIIESDLEKDKIDKFNFKSKFVVKLFISCLIVFICLVSKLLFLDTFRNNKYGAFIIKQYRTDYSKEDVCKYIQKGTKFIYSGAKYIIPESLSNKIKIKYIESIKPKIINFDLKNSVFSIIKNEPSIQNKDVDTGLNTKQNVQDKGMGGRRAN
ncbi:MAG: hypothetical protein RSE00_04485 [Clostridia bacterium]